MIIAALYMLSCSSSYYKEKRGDMTAHWLKYDDRYPTPSRSKSNYSPEYYMNYYTRYTPRYKVNYTPYKPVNYKVKPVNVKEYAPRSYRTPRSWFIPTVTQPVKSVYFSPKTVNRYQPAKVYQPPRTSRSTSNQLPKTYKSKK